MDQTGIRPEIDVEASRAAIARIRALNLQVASMEEIRELLNVSLKGCLADAPSYDPGKRLFRARICDRPRAVSELWHPPADCVKLGRANRPNNPVFYSALAKETAVFEVQPAVGDTLGVASWITTKTLLANHVGYTPQVFSDLRSLRKHDDQFFFSQIGSEINQELCQFLAETFTQIVKPGEEYRYKFSATIAELLFSDAMFDALMYPTVQMRANSDNFAIKPAFADSSLRFERIEFMRVERRIESGYEVRLLYTTEECDADGHIRWPTKALPLGWIGGPPETSDHGS
jgi:RES domain